MWVATVPSEARALYADGEIKGPSAFWVADIRVLPPSVLGGRSAEVWDHVGAAPCRGCGPVPPRLSACLGRDPESVCACAGWGSARAAGQRHRPAAFRHLNLGFPPVETGAEGRRVSCSGSGHSQALLQTKRAWDVLRRIRNRVSPPLRYDSKAVYATCSFLLLLGEPARPLPHEAG